MADIYTSPVIFSAAMIEALLSGRKTQTRRIITSQWANVAMHFDLGEEVYLWARECFSRHSLLTNDNIPDDRRRAITDHSCGFHYWADGNPEYGDWERPKPSIHMPRTASRISLKVTDVRKQRLRDMSPSAAVAEGIECQPDGRGRPSYRNYNVKDSFGGFTRPVDSFETLWNSLHGQKPGEAWDDNPEVFALTFEVIERNIIDIVEERAAA